MEFERKHYETSSDDDFMERQKMYMQMHQKLNKEISAINAERRTVYTKIQSELELLKTITDLI